jgi:hypothetical protein
MLALLDDDQKVKQEAIGLPFGRGGGGRGGPGGGEAPPEDANPFADEQNAQALTALLDRLGGDTDKE